MTASCCGEILVVSLAPSMRRSTRDQDKEPECLLCTQVREAKQEGIEERVSHAQGSEKGEVRR